MTPIRFLLTITTAVLLGSLSACWGSKISETCDEVQAYQLVVPSKRVVVPEGLDPLEEFKEMPLPKAETPPRPAGAKCIESPPSVLIGGTKDKDKDEDKDKDKDEDSSE